jgi:TPR repeat protein
MAFQSDILKLALAAVALTACAMPATADTKAGVDAWSRGAYEDAVKAWRKPASEGDAEAQFNLGQAYKLGRGVKSDLDMALDWYRKAAAQGHLQAADSCGHLLHYQQKIPQALPFLIASSDRGEPRAQYLLATELFNGVHISKDWVRAYALMTRASSSGLASASRSLAQMDQYIPIEQRQAGTELAGELEQHSNRARSVQAAGFPIDASPSAPNLTSATPPPSVIPVTSTSSDSPEKSGQGAWRIQLGAFGNAANAEKLWQKLTSNVAELAELKPIMNTGRSVTRLQTGPFASKADADAICAKIKATGQQCLAVPNS